MPKPTSSPSSLVTPARPASGRHIYPPGGRDNFSFVNEPETVEVRTRGSPGGKDSVVLTDKIPTPKTGTVPGRNRVPPGGKDSIKFTSKSFSLAKTTRSVPPCGEDHINFSKMGQDVPRSSTVHRVPPGGADHIDFKNHQTSRPTPTKAPRPATSPTDCMKSMLCDNKKDSSYHGRDLMPGASSSAMKGVLGGPISPTRPVRIRQASSAQTFTLG
mmetsp:Transcript_21202/g.35556  ORF Transcript_21202/g.35556 Transcript_21202/m.35556 type:complete len:215 (+) Transcript_21202:103-747(+)|eukprot:CAMPEP_0174979052 /NCGR_PEP_ID=MMETSP0004_2-20121128/14558_1 /TAXON_ID=420556 /ORGANISM="Ochromonas sp., Strain CCMP1393" /LENGTH=214 /DNA_ID=CAMNT_0016230519 /DNA_START=85 /DNA_END=729 /DNA_ORIENTATION=-